MHLSSRHIARPSGWQRTQARSSRLTLTCVCRCGACLLYTSFFAQRVILGKTKFDEVPKALKAKVAEILLDSGLPELVPVSYTHLYTDEGQILPGQEQAAERAEVSSLGGRTLTGYIPVSYTHLDVYKRQLLHCH